MTTKEDIKTILGQFREIKKHHLNLITLTLRADQ